ncbi:MAG: DUF2922 domain-containing protein [Synergistaceae bacterium]|nr:DUF2922 domain-containing protein [Synergistaceae bacterium]
MKSLRLKYKTDIGKDFTFSMNYADPTLAEEGGETRVQTAMDAILTQQPFSVTLASCYGAELIDRVVTEIII